MASTERKPRSNLGLWVGAGVAVAAVGGFGFLLYHAQALPDGPVPVAWDKETCANCRMHVGERGFAAQLQTRDGRVFNFDDPGCLFGYREKYPALDEHAAYFHHLREERWLKQAEVGFAPVSPTPMGYGLGAVDAAEPGALSVEAARAQVLKPHDGGAQGGRP
jgi:hypothetical protein